MVRLINRREVLKSCVGAGGSAALAAVGKTAVAQMPALQPLADKQLSLVYTTEANAWQAGKVFAPTFAWEMLSLNVDTEKTVAGSKPVQGFGGCFNELGWTALSSLAEQDRESILKDLFDPIAGARFTYCRMPIGANDFATEAYSFDETDGDFELKHFSIEHDKKTLVPFIHAAQRYQPKLRLWASPWTPPSWMKRNHFYAEAAGQPAYGFKENGIRPDQIGHEGQDMFILEPRYLEAYAQYFGRFIDAYRAEGIRVGMVMPQNEFNSAQNFPSCTWTAEGLAQFLRYLAPEMQKRDVELFFGTLERGNPELLEKIMADQDAAKYLKGVGVQWAGKDALPALSRKFPLLLVFQSEQECGDGRNAWSYTSYGWQLMKHYFRSGVAGYMYWNLALEKGGRSTWGWSQNSLVSVDPEAKTFQYNHDFYLMKHLAHFVDVGAMTLETTGTCDDALAFLNPDGSVALLVRNELAHSQLVQVHVNSRTLAVELPADSLCTVTIEHA